jgi:hypothetical protein
MNYARDDDGASCDVAAARVKSSFRDGDAASGCRIERAV